MNARYPSAIIAVASIALLNALGTSGYAGAAVAGPSFATGELDCNGYSRIQRPIVPLLPCADIAVEDNGHYVGHDEPDVQFFSPVKNSGNDLQWSIELPVERPVPATQTFENQLAFWFSVTLCDPSSYPQNPCTPDSDTNRSGHNDPRAAGSALLELQFYPPGNPKFPNKIGCDLLSWCAALTIDSVECNVGYTYCNPNCIEPINFAFIQRDGIPTGPPGPANSNLATFTPNGETLLMGQGHTLRITIEDTTGGLLTEVEDLTAHQFGFMIASSANGFQNTDLHSCAGMNFTFRPEFSTAKIANSLPWGPGIINVDFSSETGHFVAGPHGDGDSDDPPCYRGPLVAGCLGADLDFDGTSYQRDWPDGSVDNATPVIIGSTLGHGIGPVSFSHGSFTSAYPTMQFATLVAASEPGCKRNGMGCYVPPPGAAFYPFYALSAHGAACVLTFGNDIRGSTTNDFGRDKEYGKPDPRFRGVFDSGQFANPCPPHA